MGLGAPKKDRERQERITNDLNNAGPMNNDQRNRTEKIDSDEFRNTAPKRPQEVCAVINRGDRLSYRGRTGSCSETITSGERNIHRGLGRKNASRANLNLN